MSVPFWRQYFILGAVSQSNDDIRFLGEADAHLLSGGRYETLVEARDALHNDTTGTLEMAVAWANHHKMRLCFLRVEIAECPLSDA